MPSPVQLAQLEKLHGLPTGLLNAVREQETGGITNPSMAVSPKGAIGAFQFMPETAKQYGIDPRDPNQAAQAAAKMFAELNQKYQGDVPKMLAGYNWGQGNVDRKGLEQAPEETRNYIQKVMGKIGDVLVPSANADEMPPQTSQHINNADELLSFIGQQKAPQHINSADELLSFLRQPDTQQSAINERLPADLIQQLNPETNIFQDIGNLSELATRSIAQLPLGAEQAVAELLGADGVAKFNTAVASKNQNEINKFIDQYPILGSLVNMGAQGAQFAVGTPMLAGAVMGGLAPKLDPKYIGNEGSTMFSRNVLQPLGSAISSGVEMVGLDPNSRAGGALAGGAIGKTIDLGLKAALRPKTVSGEFKSSNDIIPLTKGQLSGENAQLAKEIDLRKSGNSTGSQLLNDFKERAQTPAAVDYLKKNFELPEGESYNAMIDSLMADAGAAAKSAKSEAVRLRNLAGKKAANIDAPRANIDEMVSNIDKALYSFDANDAAQTLNNIKRNINRPREIADGVVPVSEINPDISYLSSLKDSVFDAVPKPKTVTQRVRELGGVADTGGDLKGRVPVGVINSKGKGFDDIARQLKDEGYFYNVKNPDVNDLINALDDEAIGVDYHVKMQDTEQLTNWLNSKSSLNDITKELDDLGVNTVGANRQVLRQRIESLQRNLEKKNSEKAKLDVPVQLQDIFNAKGALTKQKAATGAKSAAAAKANELIDEHLFKFIDDNIITGNAEALQAYKQSVPAFKEYYSNYAKSPSNLFNKIIKDPQSFSSEELFNAVYGSKFGGSQRGRIFAEQVKKTLGKDGSKKLEQGFVDALIKKSSNDFGEVSIEKMNNYLRNFLSNKKFASSVMPKEKIIALEKLKQDLAMVNRLPKDYKDSGTAYNTFRLLKESGKMSGGIKGKIFNAIANYSEKKANYELARSSIENKLLVPSARLKVYNRILNSMSLKDFFKKTPAPKVKSSVKNSIRAEHPELSPNNAKNISTILYEKGGDAKSLEMLFAKEKNAAQQRALRKIINDINNRE